MLRGRPENKPSPPATAGGPVSPTIDYPAGDQPFTLEERPAGVSFYQAKECCFYPYALLQSLRLENDRLTLTFSVADVLLQGRNLHPLFALLATQRVARIVQQGTRHAAVTDGGVVILKMEVVVR